MTDDYKLIIEQDHQTVMAHYVVAGRILSIPAPLPLKRA